VPALILASALGLPGQHSFGQGPDQPAPPPRPVSPPPSMPAKPLGLSDLIQMGLSQNPRLRQAELDVDVAGGRATQAGLYPNPTLTFSGEEIGRRGGIHTLPQVSQEIVTAGKLHLSRAV